MLRDYEPPTWRARVGDWRILYEINDEADINLLISKLPQLEEGFVWTDYGQSINGSWVRVKCKNPAYLLAAKLLGENFGEKRALDLILDGQADDLVKAFPEHEAFMRGVRAAYEKVIADTVFDWYECKKWAADRKQFAEAAKKCEFPAALFARLDGKCQTFDQFFKALSRRGKLCVMVLERYFANRD